MGIERNTIAAPVPHDLRGASLRLVFAPRAIFAQSSRPASRTRPRRSDIKRSHPVLDSLRPLAAPRTASWRDAAGSAETHAHGLFCADSAAWSDKDGKRSEQRFHATAAQAAVRSRCCCREPRLCRSAGGGLCNPPSSSLKTMKRLNEPVGGSTQHGGPEERSKRFLYLQVLRACASLCRDVLQVLLDADAVILKNHLCPQITSFYFSS